METHPELTKSQFRQLVLSADEVFVSVKSKVMTGSWQLLSKIDDGYKLSERASELKNSLKDNTPTMESMRSKLFDMKKYLQDKMSPESFAQFRDNISQEERIQKIVEYITPILAKFRNGIQSRLPASFIPSPPVVGQKGEENTNDYHRLWRKGDIVNSEGNVFFTAKKPSRKLSVFKVTRYIWIKDGVLYILATDFRSRYYVKSHVTLRNLLRFLVEDEDKKIIVMRHYDETETKKEKEKIKRYEIEDLEGFLSELKAALEKFVSVNPRESK